jgi:hypothetical protein
MLPVTKSNFDLSELNGSIKEIGFINPDFAELVAIMNKCKELTTLSVREKVELIEGELLKLPQASMPVSHFFTDGLYIRSFTIPKGVMLTSKYHKKGQFEIMFSGKLSVVTEKGIINLIAPFFGQSSPGLKRLGYAHEDVTWIDIHANPGNEKDIVKLEQELYADSYEDMLSYEVNRNRKDFYSALKEHNILLETIQKETTNLTDQVEIDLEQYNIRIQDSVIDGKGVFVIGQVMNNTIIGPVAINNLRTQIGRYTNHSYHPNAKMIYSDINGYLVALRDIINEEVTIDYRQSRAILEKEI